MCGSKCTCMRVYLYVRKCGLDVKALANELPSQNWRGGREGSHCGVFWFLFQRPLQPHWRQSPPTYYYLHFLCVWAHRDHMVLQEEAHAQPQWKRVTLCLLVSHWLSKYVPEEIRVFCTLLTHCSVSLTCYVSNKTAWGYCCYSF